MIPRVFHQVWINRKNPDLPDKFRAYRDGWLALHPTWEYRLWNLDNLDFVPQRINLLKSATVYSQMADILRYEILARHGGVYLDTDFECLRNIDPILVGVKNFSCSEDERSVSAGIIGAVKNSVYMERCVAALPEKLGQTNPAEETGPGLLTRVLLGGGLGGDFTLFPREWFYPYNWNEPHRASEQFPQAYAVHRWAHSWADAESGLMTKIRRKVQRLLRSPATA
jgi:mannosyltransferase OCH1-like enzyme